jgi:outer membrane protein OmpA-like peptidoglycan-associated protein
MLQMRLTTSRIISNHYAVREQIFTALNAEFKEDIEKWGGTIDSTLIVRFTGPRVMFETGSDIVKPSFRDILRDFMPRFIGVLKDQPYEYKIKEIRIDGHTSKRWHGEQDSLVAHFKNIELSQDRTRRVLEYILSLNEIEKDRAWLKQKVTANGLAALRPLYVNGDVTAELSQRVEFRIIIDDRAVIDSLALETHL